MLKKTIKITSLLLVTALTTLIVPAFASERLGTKEGYLSQAIAFENSKYAYYGYKTDNVETGIWYNNGSDTNDSFNYNLENYVFNNVNKYGEKYAYAKNHNNNDEYLIDLTTGKILNDETVEDIRYSAMSKLQSFLTKSDRYSNIKNSHGKLEINPGDFKQILTGHFGEVWYQYTTSGQAMFNTDFVSRNGTSITTSKAVVFTDNNSNYIDASYIANMQLFSSKKNRAVNIDNYDKKNDDFALEVHLENIEVLAQDKDYLYTLTTVTVADTSDLTYTAPETQYFIQKISKAVGDKKDGVYLPKNVSSYQLDNKAIYDNNDSADAFNIVFNNSYGTNLDGYDANNNLYAVRDGVLYVTSVNTNKIKISTLTLSKTKVNTISANGAIVAKDVDTYLVKKTDGDDHDTASVILKNKADNTIANKSTKLSSAVSIDTEGYTWIINKGKILKYTAGNFKEIYNCDRSFDSIDVYNEGNLVAWKNGDDAYTTVREGKQVTLNDAKVIDPNWGQQLPAKIGWNKLADGTWNFYNETGTKLANQWIKDNGIWYFLKADGSMAKSWINDNGTWYYLNNSGAMQTGWLKDNNTWYYLSNSGAMQTHWFKDNGTWYYSNNSGAMQTGWIRDNGIWYYLYPSGAMAFSTVINGYKLSSSGALL